MNCAAVSNITNAPIPFRLSQLKVKAAAEADAGTEGSGEVEKLTVENGRLSGEVDRLSKDISGLSLKLEEASTSASHYKSQLDTVSTSLSEATARRDALEKSVVELKALQKANEAATEAFKKRSEKVNKMEDTIQKLTREVEEYEDEFKSLKNQDLKIKTLERKVRELQAGGDEDVERRVEEASEEILERAKMQVSEALEREAEALQKVDSLELELRAERAGTQAVNSSLVKAAQGEVRTFRGCEERSEEARCQRDGMISQKKLYVLFLGRVRGRPRLPSRRRSCSRTRRGLTWSSTMSRGRETTSSCVWRPGPPTAAALAPTLTRRGRPSRPRSPRSACRSLRRGRR